MGDAIGVGIGGSRAGARDELVKRCVASRVAQIWMPKEFCGNVFPCRAVTDHTFVGQHFIAVYAFDPLDLRILILTATISHFCYPLASRVPGELPGSLQAQPLNAP